MRSGVDWIRNARGCDKTVIAIFVSLIQRHEISSITTSATSSTTRDVSDRSQISGGTNTIADNSASRLLGVIISTKVSLPSLLTFDKSLGLRVSNPRESRSMTAKPTPALG